MFIAMCPFQTRNPDRGGMTAALSHVTLTGFKKRCCDQSINMAPLRGYPENPEYCRHYQRIFDSSKGNGRLFEKLE